MSDLILLGSVRCFIDSSTLYTYPQSADGMPDYTDEIGLDKCSLDWLNALDDQDRKTINWLLKDHHRNETVNDLIKKLDFRQMKTEKKSWNQTLRELMSEHASKSEIIDLIDNVWKGIGYDYTFFNADGDELSLDETLDNVSATLAVEVRDLTKQIQQHMKKSK